MRADESPDARIVAGPALRHSRVVRALPVGGSVNLRQCMQLFIAIYFAVYAVVGIAGLVAWWIIYQVVLARGYSVRDAVFGTNPNPAVAMDLLGGMLATGLLIYASIRNSPFKDLWMDVRSVCLGLLAMLVLLMVVRLLVAGGLHLWFGGKLDAQGDRVNLNNELFRQRNLATSIFSTVIYMILAAGLLQVDVLNVWGYRMEGVWNMLGIWLLGAILIVLHSFLYLGYGPRNNILHECFHDNNPAAPTSLLGLTGGFLLLTQHILNQFKAFEHIFNTHLIWIALAVMLLVVLVARGALQLVLYWSVGINLRRQLVINDNVAWGLIDGGLIFVLCLILISLIV